MGDEVFYEGEWSGRWSVELFCNECVWKATKQLQLNHGTHGIHRIS